MLRYLHHTTNKLLKTEIPSEYSVCFAPKLSSVACVHSDVSDGLVPNGSGVK
jgi:hypothetical protein